MDESPIYVGKGKGKRMLNHWTQRQWHRNWRLKRRLNEIEEAGYTRIICEKLFETRDEKLAYLIEWMAIDFYDFGILCNIPNGIRYAKRP